MAVFKCSFPINGILQILILMMFITGDLGDVQKFKNYGPYNLDYRNVQYCTGPKSRNLTEATIELIKIGEDYVANMNITFLAQSHIDEIKIKQFVVENNKKILLFSNKIEDPCQHYAFATIINNYFRSNKCIVKKGIYSGKLNFSNVTRTFYGKSSFYGEFQTRSVVISKQGNILCWVVNTIFSKVT